jgi:uncharacterized protein (TIGR04255 family)
MTDYIPASGDHAVEEAVVGVRFHESASDEAYEAAAKVAAELAVKHELPGRVQLDPLSLVMGRQSISSGYRPLEVSKPGHLFQRVTPAGAMEEELTLERAAVTYRTRNYRRWADVQARITGILIPAVDALGIGGPEKIAVIELRCVDRFISREGTPSLATLVRSDTIFVPPHLLDSTDFLHVHTGWFEESSAEGRTLINLNVDVGDYEGSRRASVIQVLSKQSAEVGQFFAAHRTNEDAIVKTLDELHRRDKDLLGGLLTEEVQKSINLFGEGAQK